MQKYYLVLFCPSNEDWITLCKWSRLTLVKLYMGSRHWRDSRSREILERKWSIFFYLELENWIFISRDALECQDFEEKILVLLSKFEILKKILFHFSKEWDFANRFSFSSRFFTQCLFQFSWEIIFCSLGWFWPSVFCRKGKYFKHCQRQERTQGIEFITQIIPNGK